MKRKEREHLKEDPFQLFIGGAIDLLKKYKKELLIGFGAALVLVLAIIVIGIVRTGSLAGENTVYSDALTIKNDAALTVDQKIEKMSALKDKGGISASINLFLAALYFEKDDFQKASDTLNDFNSSNPLLKSEKKLLEAEILNASDKKKDALQLLNTMLADPKSQIAKDFILMRMAKIQVKDGQNETAVTNLNKLIDEYPQSYYSYEARNLIKELEK